MQILSEHRERCSMALGNFDGLHKAHMAIINSCTLYAAKTGMKSGVLLFDRHTSGVFGKKVKLLTTVEEKLEILRKSGVDFVHIMHFDEKTADMSDEDFIKYITSKFSVEAFFVGYDYSFGKGAKGNAESLKKYGENHGFKTFVTECVKENGVIVSSTAVRRLIEQGDMLGAEKLLGRKYFVSGEVVKGFGNGTRSLFPTANVQTAEDKFLPGDGVYTGITTVDGKRYRCAVNVGKNPTFNAENRTIESFILQFDGELYGKNITVEFVEKIRPDKKFETVEDLKEQIKKDIEKAEKTEI